MKAMCLYLSANLFFKYKNTSINYYSFTVVRDLLKKQLFRFGDNRFNNMKRSVFTFEFGPNDLQTVFNRHIVSVKRYDILECICAYFMQYFMQYFTFIKQLLI